MFDRMKKGWQSLRESRPGSRFQDQYRRRHEGTPSPWRRALFLGAGTLLAILGLFLMPAPGPGAAVVFIGGLLLSRESLTVARLFDWLEMRSLRLLAWARRSWRRMSTPARTGAVVLVVSMAGALGFAAIALYQSL